MLSRHQMSFLVWQLYFEWKKIEIQHEKAAIFFSSLFFFALHLFNKETTLMTDIKLWQNKTWTKIRFPHTEEHEQFFDTYSADVLFLSGQIFVSCRHRISLTGQPNLTETEVPTNAQFQLTAVETVSINCKCVAAFSNILKRTVSTMVDLYKVIS